MSIGDGAAQLSSDSSRIDMKRNLVSATYNGLMSPCFFRWYRFMDWLVPGVAISQLIPKVVFSQLVTTGANNPLYLTWCNHVEAWACCAPGAAVDWPSVRAETAAQICRELPRIYSFSMLFWLPVTGANYSLVPDHLKILFISSASVLWGGFVSHVAHRASASLADSDGEDSRLDCER